jgi:hypothetical protein
MPGACRYYKNTTPFWQTKYFVRHDEIKEPKNQVLNVYIDAGQG